MTPEHKHTDYEYLNLENIIIGIKSSPLEKEVRQEAIAIVRKESKRINELLDSGKLKAPGSNYELFIATFVINLIEPVLKSYNIPGPNKRDTVRNIYDAIGGRIPSNYEVTDYLKNRENQR